MSVTRPGRPHQRWSCWFGERAQFERVLTAFDDAAVEGDATKSGAGRHASEAAAVERGREHERRGPWREVLDEVNVDAVTEFAIAVAEPISSHQGDLWLEFSAQHGVSLKASPGQVERLSRVKLAVARQIEPCVPRWSWLRSEAAAGVAAVVFGVLVELVWLTVTHQLDDPSPASFAAFPVGILIAFAALYWLRRRFPRFRIRPDSIGAQRVSS